MGLYVNVHGERYDSSEPCFLTTEQGVRVWDRVKRMWWNWESLVAKATEEGHTWQPREVGIPSLLWQLSNSRKNGKLWAPGLDDTEALASELVANGEEWTGATGSTPPTSWTSTGGTNTFQIFSGTLNITADPVLGGGMEQVLTGTPGTYYVVEVLNEIDTTAGVSLTIDGIHLPIGPGPVDDDGDGGASEVLALSFPMPASGTVTIGITCAGGELASIGHIRCFEEAELTGNPGGGGSATVTPAPDPVSGPHSMAGGESFWVNSDNCTVGFDLDGNGTPDDWHSGDDVCASSLTDAAKMGISAKLVDAGCAKLPCVTANGRMTAAYLKAQEVKITNDDGDEKDD